MADFTGLRITRWAGHHENAHSRKVRGPLPWVRVPVMQGQGYCRLVAKHGAAGLGVWLALLEIAAGRDAEKRGEIPGALEDVALMARLPASEIATVLPTLEWIGWVERNGCKAEETGAMERDSDGMERDSTQMSLEESRGEERRGEETDAPRASRAPGSARRPPSQRQRIIRALADASSVGQNNWRTGIRTLERHGLDLDAIERLAGESPPGVGEWPDKYAARVLNLSTQRRASVAKGGVDWSQRRAELQARKQIGGGE